MTLPDTDWELYRQNYAVPNEMTSFLPSYWFTLEKTDALWSSKASASGPTSYRNLAATFDSLQKSNRPPFLIVKILNWQRAMDLGYISRAFVRPILKEAGYALSTAEEVSCGIGWLLPTCNAQNKAAVYLDQQYVTCNFTLKSLTGAYEYIKVGDIINYFNSPYILFAHKSIVQSFPPTKVYNDQAAYANVQASLTESAFMYFPIGMMHSNTNQNCPAVLKAFLKVSKQAPRNDILFSGEYNISLNNKYTRPDLPSNIINPFFYFLNTWSVDTARTQYTIFMSVRDAVRNFNKCFLRGQTAEQIFQGLYNATLVQQEKERIKQYMFGYCNTDLADLEASGSSTDLELGIFPNICACIGRRGVEKALQDELGSNLARLECISAACAGGSPDQGVYRFPIEEDTCVPINICKVDIDANMLNMKNVTICSEQQPDTSSTPSPSDTTSSDTSSGSPNDAPAQTDSTPAPPTVTVSTLDMIVTFINNNKVLAGGAAIGVLIIIIIMAVLFSLPDPEPESLTESDFELELDEDK